MKHSRGRRCVEVLPQIFVISLLFGTLIFLCTNTSFIKDDTAIVGIFTFGFAVAKLTVSGSLSSLSAATSTGSCLRYQIPSSEISDSAHRYSRLFVSRSCRKSHESSTDQTSFCVAFVWIYFPRVVPYGVSRDQPEL